MAKEKKPFPELDRPEWYMDLQRAREVPRYDDDGDDDGAVAHVSDLFMCVRAAWFRRHGFPEDTSPTAGARLKMELGLGYERANIDKLLAAGADVVHGDAARFWIGPRGLDEAHFGELPVGKDKHAYITGHPDEVGSNYVIDYKTTFQWAIQVEPKPHNEIQVATYALAWRKSEARLLVAYPILAKDSDDVPEVPFTFDPEPYRDRINARIEQVLELTHPAQPEIPPAKPYPESEAWACKTCRHQKTCRTVEGLANEVRSNEEEALL